MDLIQKALQFATEKHKDQTYNGSEYIEHPKQTAQILEALMPEDTNLIAAGFLHDVLEDTPTSKEELEKEFNPDIANLVWQATKDENKDFSHISTFRGLILKIADRLSNVSSYEGLTTEKRAKLFNKYASGFIHERSNLINWPTAIEDLAESNQ